MSYKKPLFQLDPDTRERINIFTCVNDACRKLGIPSSNMHSAAAGHRPIANHFGWEYLIRPEEYGKYKNLFKGKLKVNEVEPKIEITEEYWIGFERAILSTIMHLPEKNKKSINLKLTTYLNL